MRPAQDAAAKLADEQGAWHGIAQTSLRPEPADFERRLADARPRLVRLARDGAGNVTRRVETLRAPLLD
jgi:hypothetical protein